MAHCRSWSRRRCVRHRAVVAYGEDDRTNGTDRSDDQTRLTTDKAALHQQGDRASDQGGGSAQFHPRILVSEEVQDQKEATEQDE